MENQCKFNVGDRVYVAAGETEDGATGTVTRLDGDVAEVAFDNGDTGSYWPHELGLAEEASEIVSVSEPHGASPGLVSVRMSDGDTITVALDWDCVNDDGTYNQERISAAINRELRAAQ